MLFHVVFKNAAVLQKYQTLPTFIKLKKADYKIRDGVQRVKVLQFDRGKSKDKRACESTGMNVSEKGLSGSAKAERRTG